MMNTITALSSPDWQPALHVSGERVSGVEDIQQCLRLILGTPKGSDPHRPDFGSDLHRYLDMPVERAFTARGAGNGRGHQTLGAPMRITPGAA